MAGKIKNIAGMRFGRLIAVSVDKEKSSYGKTYWICEFSTHRDRLGAMNIMLAPVADGVA